MPSPHRSRSAQATHLGAFLYGAAMVALAAQNLSGATLVSGLEPLPTALPDLQVWAIGNSVLLLGGGAGIILQRARGQRAVVPAAILGVLLILWIVLLQTRVLVAEPTNGSWWSCLFEALAIGSAAWVLAGIDSPYRSNFGRDTGVATWGTKLGRLGYGLSLPAFGVLHLLYPKYIAAAIPAWLPWHLFWGYFVAAAFFAAGASLLGGVKARLAALWTGIMFLSWVLMLHLPRVLRDPHNRFELTSLLIALAMGGGAWIVAESYEKLRAPEARL